MSQHAAAAVVAPWATPTSYLVTGHVGHAASIAAVEVATKIVLY